MRALARGAAITAVSLGVSLVAPGAAAAQNAAWQVHDGGARHSFGLTIPNGDFEGFLSGAQIPAQNSGGWTGASNTLALRWTGPGGVPCRTQAKYAYFQTVVRPQPGQGFSLAFTNVDDAVRVTVFNARHPGGATAPGGVVGLRENKTVDLTPLLVPGGDNRVVITLADVCGAGHGVTVQLQPTEGGGADADTPGRPGPSSAAQDGARAADQARPTLPLAPGTELVRGQRYWSASGGHFLTLNPDGNLVVARADGGYVWGFDTQPNIDFRRVGRVVWQADGNLAAYAADGAYLWSALTENPDPNARLVLQANGALQIISGNQVRWTSMAAAAAPARPAPAPAPRPAPAPAPVRDGSEDEPGYGDDSPVRRLAQTDTGALTLASTQAGARRGSPVAFVSTDGTASVGSRTVFIVRNNATGESTLVPVAGNDAESRTVAYLAPGAYTVTPPAPSVGQFSTFTTRSVSASQITVPAAPANSTRPVATVSFSLEVQRAPVVMLTTKVTGSSVELAWGAGRGIEVGEYVLVRTDGSNPAANPSAGTRVPLSSPTATSAVVRGLADNRQYTFTLFSTSRSGEVLEARAYSVSTASEGSQAAAFAVAANTIMPTDFASLRAERIAESAVRVTLDPARIQRGSGSTMPGLESAVTQGGGCVVGTPFLVRTDISAQNSFFGVIDVCESSNGGVSRAIVNTDVPLSSVFNFYHLASNKASMCFNPVTGTELAENAAQCSGNAPRSSAAPPAPPAPPVDVNRLQPPARAGTGEIQVTLLWASGDDLDVHVTDPAGAVINWREETSTSGGKLDIDNRGGDCASREERAENVFWQRNAPRGTYSVDVQNYRSCGGPATAKIQVRVGGELLVDQIVNVGVDMPIFFELGEEGAVRLASTETKALDKAVNRPALAVRPHQPSVLAAAKASTVVTKASFASFAAFSQDDVEAGPISCEGSASASFDLGAHFGPHFEHEIEVSGGKLHWDIEAGVTAGINPQAEISGEVECSAEFDGKEFQLSTYPVPINLELKPDVSAKASATLSLDGPKLGLTLGIKSDGSLGAKTEWCRPWLLPDFPCGVDIDLRQNTRPLTRFERGDAEATLTGTLEFAAGIQANLGIGVKNSFVTAKTGFSLRMYPLAAELTAVVGTANCIEGKVGAKLGVDFLAEAYILAFGDEIRETLYESDVLAYPGAEFEIGSCPEDD